MKNTEKTDELLTLAARLADAREKADLSAQEMADRLEVSFEEYTEWEAGTAKPDTETVRRAAAVLHVTGNYLLFGPTREGMVGAMFPNKAQQAVLPVWYGCMMAGAAFLFCGGAGMLLMLFAGRTVKTDGAGALLSYLPFQVFLGICIIGVALCITALILRSKNKKKEQEKGQGNGRKTNR